MIKQLFYIPLILGILAGCSGLEDSEKEKIRKMNASGQIIYRSHDESYFTIEEPISRQRDNYYWEDTYVGSHVRITKEFFRCRGSPQNAPITKSAGGENTYTIDCGGMQQHSLPLREGKEYIYPALLDLLNYIQEKTKKKVVITCGHRCPTHNTYSDGSIYNQTSKHMVGGEVDFYVKGLEWSPEKVVELLQTYYQEHADFQSIPEFNTFHRYEGKTNTTTLPWYNKEIFVKLFKKDEGRDLDNHHRFPYICIQLKWNRDDQDRVTYSWSKAFNGYLRY